MVDEITKVDFQSPTQAMIDSPEFNAVWNLISSWEIKAPGISVEKANCTHVKIILEAIKGSRPSAVMDVVKKLKYKSLGNKAKQVLIDQLDEMLNNTII